MSAAWEIQKAVFSRLYNDAALTALLAENPEVSGAPGVYDHVPQVITGDTDAPFPYVVIGEDTMVEWDTDTERGFDATLTIHVWSRYRGRKETKEIQGAIYDALHRYTDIVVTGYHVVECFYEYSDTTLDPDGLTRHGVQKFRLVMEDE